MPMSSRRRPRRRSHAATRRHWTELVAEYERGTLNQRAFCEQHALGLSSFTRWRRRILAERAQGSASFVRVALADERPASRAPETLRLTLPSGVRIEGVNASNLALLAELVRAL